MQAALGDDEFGLLDDGRGDAEQAVHERRGQGQAAGPADQEDRGQLAGADAGILQDGADGLEGAFDGRAGQGVELLAAERRVGADTYI